MPHSEHCRVLIRYGLVFVLHGLILRVTFERRHHPFKEGRARCRQSLPHDRKGKPPALYLTEACY